MTAIEEAAKLYEANGLTLSTDLENYIKYGYVFITPERVLFGRPVLRSAGVGHWLQDTSKADAWFIKLAVGKGGLQFFHKHMPYFLPFIAWQRNFKGDMRDLHIYSTDRLTNILYGKHAR